MSFIRVELKNPGDIVERWRIPVVRKKNIPQNTMRLEFGRGSRKKLVKFLLVGYGVSQKDIEAYFKGYLIGKDIWPRVELMRLMV